MAGGNNVSTVQNGQNEGEGELHLSDWPESVPMADANQENEDHFVGRRLMSVPENLDEELSMDFDSDKDKNLANNEDVSDAKCTSDASMSSKDVEEHPKDSDFKAQSGESWTDEEPSDNFTDSLDAEGQNEAVGENPI